MKNSKFLKDKCLESKSEKHIRLTNSTHQEQNHTSKTININESLFKAIIKADLALNSVNDAILFTDAYGCIDYMNNSAEDVSGWKCTEAIGLPINQVFKLIDCNTHLAIPSPIDLMNQSIDFNIFPNETILIKQDGSEIIIEDSLSPIINHDGEFMGVVIVFRDVSTVKEKNLKLAHFAQYDFLTNLPNRMLLLDRIGQAIAKADRDGTQVALLFLDIDKFKHINDSFGHAEGDKLLQSVANCLMDCVRNSDTVSRQGGDEFIVLLAENKESEDVILTAGKILEQISLLNIRNNLNIAVTTSIGVSIYPIDGNGAETLIKNADTAMYHAKKLGGNNYQFFSRNMKINKV